MNTLSETADRVFAPGLVTALERQGMDFIEAESLGAYIHDAEGNAILDAHTGGGIYNLGRHPKELAQALQDAARQTDQGNFVLISREKAELARAMAAFMPGALDCSYFTVVRGEAMEAACKLARGKTRRPGLVSFTGGFHGDTGFALSLGDLPGKEDFGPLIPGITTLPFNSVDSLRKTINNRTAAVILEPVQVENGCIPAEQGFVKAVRTCCDKAGALLIIDETQTGFGRTGTKFACQTLDVEPDILVYGEAVCGGMFNMCGLAFTPEVKTFFDDHPLIHLCTFGGHDVGCRTAMAALDSYDRIRPWKKAADLAKSFNRMLEKVRTASPDTIRRVRSQGLAGALVFETDDLAEAFCKRVRGLGALVMTGRINRAAVIIRPPLTITKQELSDLGQILEKGAERP